MSEQRKPFVSETTKSVLDGGHKIGGELRNHLSTYANLVAILEAYFVQDDKTKKAALLESIKRGIDTGHYTNNLEYILSVLKYDDFAGNVYDEAGDIVIPNVGDILERERKKTLSKIKDWHLMIQIEIRELVEKEFPMLKFVSVEYDMCHRTIFFYSGGSEHDIIVIVVKEDGHIEVQNGSVHNGPYTTVLKVSDLKEAISQYV